MRGKTIWILIIFKEYYFNLSPSTIYIILMFGAASERRRRKSKIYNLVSVIYMGGPNFDLSSNLIYADV